MNDEYKYIRKIIQSKWKSVQAGKSEYVFIHTLLKKKNDLKINKILKELTGKKQLCSKYIDISSNYAPYFPFIDILNSNLKKNSEKQLYEQLKRSQIYPLHISAFINCIKDNNSFRTEDILLGELEYEIEQIYVSICNLFKSISTSTPFVIYIAGLHNASYNTLKLIEYLIKNLLDCQILFIFSLDMYSQNIIDDINDFWNIFLSNIENNLLILKTKVGFGSIKDNYDSEMNSMLSFKNIFLNYSLLALEDCKKYAVSLYSSININNQKFDEKLYVKLLILLGDVHYYLNENDQALFYYSSLLNIVTEKKETQLIAETYLKMSHIYFTNQKYKTCKKMLSQSHMLAQKIQASSLMFKIKYYIAVYNYKSKNMFSNDSLKDKSKNIKKIIKEGEELKYRNMLAHLYEIQGDMLAYLKPKEAVCIDHYEVSIEYSAQNFNELRLANSLEKKGNAYLNLEMSDKALECFKRSNEIKMNIANNLEIARSFNSLGYYYYLVQDYQQALDNFYQAFDYLRGYNSYKEIIITLFNVSRTYFFARYYEKSLVYSEVVLKIMKVLSIGNLGFYTLNELLLMISISYLKTDNYARSLIFQNRVSDVSNADEAVLYELLQALIEGEEHNFKKSEKYFKNVKIIVNKEKKYFIMNKGIKNLSLMIYYEFGMMYKKSNQTAKADKIFKQGMENCAINNLLFAQLFLNELKESNNIKSSKLKLDKGYNYNLDSLIMNVQQEKELSRQKKSLYSLHKKINEINFLNNLQTIFTKTLDKDKLINDVADLIHHSMLIEDTFIILQDGNDWKCIYSKSSIDEKENKILELVNELNNKRMDQLIIKVEEDSVYNKYAELFSSFIYSPLKSKNKVVGAVLCANIQKDLKLTGDDLRIISIAASQLSFALEKIVLIEKLKELDKIKTQFFSNISHELRTPLTLILSPVETILNGSIGKLVPHNHDYISSVHKNSLRLLKLINNILDFSKIEAGKMKAKIQRLNIDSEIKYLSSCLRAATDAKNIECNYSTTNESIEIYLDRDMFEKIIMNILSNSFKFTPENGQIDININENKYDVIITVRDSGCGIPSDQIDRVFDQFMQVNLNNRNSNEGTGIGLSLVKQLVEFHKGKIYIESEIGKGTLITLKFLKGFSHLSDEVLVDELVIQDKKINYLNLIDFDYTKENNNNNQFYLSLESNKYDLGIFKDAVILIVEDNKDMRNFMFSLLGNITTVLMASDGVEGLTLAKRYKPDLIISDIMMPKMNGYELCNRIKNEAELEHSAVILLTAKTEVKMQIRGYESGADAYIGKPFNNNEFIAKIYSMLRIRSHQKYLTKENTTMIKENKKVKKINAKLLEINQELDKYSRTDVLTGLSNRRDFTEKVNYELSRVHRSKGVFSILMCDIDYFKKVNDTYGHDCGDYVLIYIADLLRTTLREQDIIARWGGEEFIVLLPDTNLKGAKEIDEKLRRRVAREQYTYNSKKFKLTVSIGIGAYEEGHTIDDCIKIADESLYVAKETGRNKVLSLTSRT